ncbi:MAG: TolC family protein [Bdellovibrionota bacterium]
MRGLIARSIVAIAVLTVPCLGFAAKTVNLTYDDLAKLVQENNKTVTGTKRFTEAAETRTGHLVRSYLPTLRAEAGGEAFQTGAYKQQTEPYGGAEARINLFRGGRDALEEDARQAQVQASNANEKRTYLSELNQARDVYWSLVFTKEMINILNDAVEQNEKALSMANRRIQRGLGTETDRLEFEIYRSQLKEEIESLEHETKLIEIRLAAIVGLDTDTRFKTPVKIEHEHDDPLIQEAYSPASHPEVVSLKASSESFYAQKSASNRWWAPSVDIYAGYYLYTLRDRDYLARRLRDDTVAGVRFTFELFDGLRSASDASAFSLQAQGYEEQADQRIKNADAHVQVAKEDLKHDHELIHNAEERIVQGKKYLARTLDEYNRGVKNSIDVLGAAQKYQSFLRQYAERRRDYKITKDGLLALMGK